MMLIPALVVLAAAPAVCSEGKAVSPDTAGHCCWPQQAWSNSRQVCVGAPACPAGLKAQGEECVGGPACPAGMEQGPDTAGHCCWPQQVWSASRQQCVGAPKCPPRFSAQGEACMADASEVPPPPPPPPGAAPSAGAPPPPPPPVAPPAAPPASVSAAPAAAVGPDGAPAGFHYEKQRIKGLIIPGAVLLGVGYLISLAVELGGAAWAIAYPENKCWGYVSTVAWIPLIGPALSIEGQRNLYRGTNGNLPCTSEPLYPVGVAVAVVDTVMQWAGLGLLITGLVIKRDVLVENEPAGTGAADGPHWYFAVGAPGSSLGLTVGLTGW